MIGRSLIKRNQFGAKFPNGMAVCSGLSTLLLLIVLTATTTAAYQLYDECTDGAGARGICTPLKSCDSLAALLRRGSLTNEQRSYITKSNCGMLDGGHAVCCPLPKKLTSRFGAIGDLPEVGICGRVTSNRIFGGQIAALDDFPWLARIQYYKSQKRFGFHCGGVLINDHYVLTAAHCIESIPSSWSLYKIRLGEYDTQSDIECDASVFSVETERECVQSVLDMLIASYYIHENYFQENGADYNDIALIRLAQSIAYTNFIQPICLPTTDELQRLDSEGHQLTVAGWGQTENKTSSQYKMYVKVPGWNNERCRESFSPVNVDIIQTQLCAGGNKGEDSCRGDSGGPLMKVEKINGKNAWILKGIVSFGTDRCGTENIPGVYTRVSDFVSWILENIEE